MCRAGVAQPFRVVRMLADVNLEELTPRFRVHILADAKVGAVLAIYCD